jgi:iron uptake system component EfeO
MRRAGLGVLVTIALGVAAGCGTAAPSAAPPGSPSDVTGTVTAATAAPRSTLVGTAVVDQYRAFALDQVQMLQAATTTFTDAVRRGDLAAAQAAYAPARASYERMEPVAELFEDLDSAIDSRVDAHAGPDDPEWTGFHRIELGLFQQHSTAGPADVADKLDADVTNLIGWVRAVRIDPVDVVKGAQTLLEEVARNKVTGEEDRYSHTDLSDFGANVEGGQVIWRLVEPAAKAVDPTESDEIDARFASVLGVLAPYRNADGTWRRYDTLAEADWQQLAADVAALSESMARLPGTLGLG